MKKHVHRYERRRLGSFKKTGHEIYKCAVPGCPHYMVDLEAVVGRYSQCWGMTDGMTDCPNEVEMTRYLIFSEKRKRPLCDECKAKRKDKRDEGKVEKEMEVKIKAIERLLGGLDAPIYDE